MNVDDIVETLANQKSYENEDPAKWPTPMPLYAHQTDVLSESKDSAGWGYYMDMGAGKSAMIIHQAFYLWLHGKIDVLIVIAPNGVYQNWTLRELPKHKPADFKALRLSWPKNHATKKMQAKLDKFKKPYDGLKVFSVNIEGLSRGTSASYKYLASLIKASKGRVLVTIDESTCIKNIKAARTKNVMRLREAIAYRRILTGTPITQSPLDMFSQLHFLDPAIHGCKNYYSFEGKYSIKETFTYGPRSFAKVTGYRDLEDLKERMSSKGSFFDKASMDLPEKIYMAPRYVELTKEQEKAYFEMENVFRHEVESGMEITASTALVKLSRLHQILMGWVNDEDGNEISLPHNRLDVLEEVLAETGNQQSIVWSNFKGPLREMKNHFGDKAVYFYGDIKNDERERAIDSFMAGDAQYFVANQMSAGHGLTLTAATNVVYYSNTFNLEQRLQSEDRCHRPGQVSNVTYTDLMVKDTMEEGVISALQNKISIGSQVISSYKKLLRI